MVEEEIRFLLENEEFNEAVDRLLTLDNRMSVLLNFIGEYNAISQSGDPKKALELLNKCLLISEKLKIPEAISQSLNFLSFAYMLLGDFNNALVHLKRSYSICKDIQDYKWIYTTYLNMIGIYHHLTGDLNKAEDSLKEMVEICEENDLITRLAWAYYNLARVYRSKYQLNESLDVFNKGFFLFQEREDIFGIAVTLFQVILVKLELNLIDEAKNNLGELKKLSDRNNPQVDVRMNLAEGLILKRGPRAVHKTEAQKLFEQIISDRVIDHEMTVIAMLNLCELLIDEIRIYREEEAIIEFEQLIEDLLRISKDYNSYSIFIDIHLINSRFKLVMGFPKEAQEILNEGFMLAEEKGLKELSTKISKERVILENEIQKWGKYTQANLSLPDRINQAELNSYINRALKALGRI